MKVAPSLLAADFLHLEKDVRMLNDNADYIHLDVMDGTLVPNISFGFSVIEAISKIATAPMDAHLMVVHPERWFERLSELGVRMVSFHYEATRNPRRLLRKIKSLGMTAGIAIDPDVQITKLFRLLKDADFVLIMSVFAGFGGQKFIYESIDRVVALKEEISRRGCNCLIEVDGGIGPDNVKALSDAGADIVVAGSSVFRSPDPATTIASLREHQRRKIAL